MDDLVQIFLEESREIMACLEEDLLALERGEDDSELIARIFRAAHTIKGSAGLTGLDDISSLAHKMEDILDEVRQEHKHLSKECFETLLKGVDMLNRMLDLAANDDRLAASDVEGLKVKLASYVGHDEVRANEYEGQQSQEQERIYKVQLGFRKDIFESGTDPLRLLVDLAEKVAILEGSTSIADLPPLCELDPYQFYLDWQLIVQTSCSFSELEEVFVFVLDDNAITITDITEVTVPQAEHAQKKEHAVRSCEEITTIRVDTRRLEGVLNLVAELVISQSRIKDLVSRQFHLDEEAANSFQEVDKIIRRLQEEVMKTSMVPIGPTFTRFQRMVRDLATEQGKLVGLVISGQETELDKRVIEQITDPLKHMIRNSLDHGLESPEQRLQAGKPEEGRISLNAFHQEGSIVIEVSDDGRGLDPEAILRKAVDKGLVDEGTKLSQEEILSYITQPGFSTAPKITDISGRGVGLDVVATNIGQLRGTLEVHSLQGQGTKFLIKLPLTLAIIDGMMVTVGDERYILPLTSIVEFIKGQAEDIKTVEGKGQVVKIRNEYLPLACLHQLLGVPARKIEPTEGLLVIIRDNRKKLALLVDDILGQEQVVTKSLKENYAQVDGVAGATILGDGRVTMILDIPTIIKMAAKTTRKAV